MKTVGIIAEFNPFHSGHAYIIEKAKEITGADKCVIVMSGNFVQRGTPAVYDKYLRTKMALSCGADAVFELPVAYATASAEIFAEAGVKLLYTLGCVDYIAFGSECGDINRLMSIAEILVEEPIEYRSILSSELKSGKSFPVAREAAVISYTKDESMSDILKLSNNILAIEYCKALIRLEKTGNSNYIPKPVTITRIGSGYNDSTVNPGSDAPLSATAIRAVLENATSFEEVRAVLQPEVCLQLLEDNFQRTLPVVTDDFSDMLYIRLATMPDAELSNISDMNPDILNAVSKYKNEPISYSELLTKLKSKNNTYSGLSRLLLHIMLGIDSSFISFLKNTDTLPYARLLGFKVSSSELLRKISDNENCCLITKPADADRTNPLFIVDIKAADCYRQIQRSKFEHHSKSDFEIGTIRL